MVQAKDPEMQAQRGNIKGSFLEVVVVEKRLRTAVMGLSLPLWSCLFLLEAWLGFCQLQHHYHFKARLLHYISPSSSLSIACFYQRGVGLCGQPCRKIKEFCAVFPLNSLLTEMLRPPPLPFLRYYQNALRGLADEMVSPCNSLSLV